MATLSPRLAAVAAYVRHGSTIVDIGTDHALLPIFLVSRGICPRAIGVDLNIGPVNAAIRAVRESNLTDFIEIRQGNGLQAIGPGEADQAVLAGMGGATIIEILEAAPEVLAKLSRLVIQPMVAGGRLRLWLADNGWLIAEETLVRDEGRIYEIIAAEQGGEESSGYELEFGPRLLAEKPPLLREHLKRLLASDEKIYEGLTRSRQAPRNKVNKVRERIAYLKRVIECL